jgi:hypothetical protein
VASINRFERDDSLILSSVPEGVLHWRAEVPMDERQAERFQEAVGSLETLAGEIKPPEAWRAFGDQHLEDFWRAWPEVRAWAQWLWQLVDDERREHAAQVSDPDLDESGGGD